MTTVCGQYFTAFFVAEPSLGEYKRIKAAGGWVSSIPSERRVNGNLNLSRALGDFAFKSNELLPPEQQVITCDPYITEHTITREDEFVVIACDGTSILSNSARDFPT